MKEIATALLSFQNDCPVINQNAKAYNYKYADLGSIIETIRPILSNNNLVLTQLVGSEIIETILIHTKSGEQIKSETKIPQNVSLKGMNEFQTLGSAITYVRRYAISAMLGIVTEEDMDAKGEQEKKHTVVKKRNELPEEEYKNALNINDVETLKIYINTNRERMSNLQYKYLVEHGKALK